MKIGDLVRYSGRKESFDGQSIGAEVGIVIDIYDNSVLTVLWSNGVESNHSSGWITRMEGSA